MRVAEAAHGNLLTDGFQNFGLHRHSHFRRNISGADGVHSDALIRAFLRQRHGEADDPRLGRAVICLAELALAAVDGGNVNDATPFALSHTVDDLTRAVELAVQIDADHGFPLGLFHLVQKAIARDARVVHENINAAVFFFNRAKDFFALAEVRDVAFVNVHARFGLKGARIVHAANVNRDDVMPGPE